MDDVILRYCPHCGRKTAHDAVAISRDGANPCKITVHYCSAHPGAQRDAIEELVRQAAQCWGSR